MATKNTAEDPSKDMSASNEGVIKDTTDKSLDSCHISQTNNFMINTLDEMEKQVEALRDKANQMVEDKKRLLSSLDTMLQSQALADVSEAEREELDLFIDRLIKRCLTVEVSVQIIRSSAQEKALQAVLGYLRDLVGLIHTKMTESYQVIERYLNSCLTETQGPVDGKFQAALLECTAEDQKDVKKQLESLRHSIEREERSLSTARDDEK